MEMPAPDVHHLRAAVGWLELGNAHETLVELEKLDPSRRLHPSVLETRWLALAQLHRWEPAADTARALVAAAPERAVGWLHRSYALRRVRGGGLQAAFDSLLPVAEKFPQEPTIPYNLACYTCQLQHDPAETLAWLEKAVATGEREEIFRLALSDPDLKPLHAEIAQRAKRAG